MTQNPGLPKSIESRALNNISKGMEPAKAFEEAVITEIGNYILINPI